MNTKPIQLNKVIEEAKTNKLVSKVFSSKYYFVTDTNDADYKYREREIEQHVGRTYLQTDEEFSVEVKRYIEGLTFIKSMLEGEDYLLDEVNSLGEMYDFFEFEEDELSEEDYIHIMRHVGWSVGINSNYGHTLEQVRLVLGGEEYELVKLNQEEMKKLIISWNPTKFYYDKEEEVKG